MKKLWLGLTQHRINVAVHDTGVGCHASTDCCLASSRHDFNLLPINYAQPKIRNKKISSDNLEKTITKLTVFLLL